MKYHLIITPEAEEDLSEVFSWYESRRKRFPYKIFYRIEQKTVVVLAVVYGGRDPTWIKK